MPTITLIDFFARDLPFTLPWTLLAVVAAIDLRRNGRRGQTWVEWACFAIGIGHLVLVLVRNDLKTFSTGAWKGVGDVRNLVAVTPLVAIIINAAIVLRFGPAWRRWLGRGDRQAL